MARRFSVRLRTTSKGCEQSAVSSPDGPHAFRMTSADVPVDANVPGGRSVAADILDPLTEREHAVPRLLATSLL
jgi:hypothetical protein